MSLSITRSRCTSRRWEYDTAWFGEDKEDKLITVFCPSEKYQLIETFGLHCYEGKGLEHYGECNDFLRLLSHFAYDKERGDDGKRIEQCRTWVMSE